MSQSTIDTKQNTAHIRDFDSDDLDDCKPYVATFMTGEDTSTGLGSEIIAISDRAQAYEEKRKVAHKHLMRIAGTIGYGIISGGQHASIRDVVIATHDSSDINAASCLLVMHDIHLVGRAYRDHPISDMELDVFHGIYHGDYKAADKALIRLIHNIEDHSRALRRRYGSWMDIDADESD